MDFIDIDFYRRTSEMVTIRGLLDIKTLLYKGEERNQ